jgi:hypothetical protein
MCKRLNIVHFFCFFLCRLLAQNGLFLHSIADAGMKYPALVFLEIMPRCLVHLASNTRVCGSVLTPMYMRDFMGLRDCLQNP